MINQDKIDNTGFFSKISNFLFGDITNFTLENRIFNVSVFITFLTAFCSLLINIYSDYDLISNLIYIGFIFVFIVLYYYGRIKKICQGFIYFILSMTAISFLWFLNEGINGTVPLVITVAILIFTSVTKIKHHYFVLVITIIFILSLVVAEKSFLEEFLVKYSKKEIKEFQLIYGLILSVIVVFSYSHILKKNFLRENETIRKQEKELADINATKDKLFSIISHDLRSPFNAIIGASELMCDTSKDMSIEKMRNFAEQINKLGKNTYKLLDNLLNWSYLKQGKIPYKPGNFNLYDLVNECTCINMDIPEKKRINIFIDIDKELNIQADRNMLQVIIGNLFSNALKYTNSGGSVKISAKKMNSIVYISIKDTGIGMAEEVINSLFNIETQYLRKGTDDEPSFGIGLILSKGFIEKHNGILTVISEPNKGSEFKFTIPQA